MIKECNLSKTIFGSVDLYVSEWGNIYLTPELMANAALTKTGDLDRRAKVKNKKVFDYIEAEEEKFRVA